MSDTSRFGEFDRAALKVDFARLLRDRIATQHLSVDALFRLVSKIIDEVDMEISKNPDTYFPHSPSRRTSDVTTEV